MKRIRVVALILTVAILAMPLMIFDAHAVDYETFGNTTGLIGPGYGGNSILNIIGGAAFVCPYNGLLLNVTAFIAVNGQAKHMKAAVYDASYNLLANSDELLVPNNGYVPTWYNFTFPIPLAVTAGTTYVLVVWAELDSKSGSADLWYIPVATQDFLEASVPYNDWPNHVSLIPDNGGIQTERPSIYATVDSVPGNVVPEVPWGPIAASASMILALVGYVTYPKLKRKL